MFWPSFVFIRVHSWLSHFGYWGWPIADRRRRCGRKMVFAVGKLRSGDCQGAANGCVRTLSGKGTRLPLKAA